MKLNFMLTPLVLYTILSCTTVKNTQQSTETQQLAKDTRGNDMLLGICPRESLMKSPFSEWFNSGYETYKTDAAIIKEIQPLLKDKKIQLFLGTWCGDSKREVPRMLKILDEAKLDAGSIELIMVSNHPDMYKQSPQHEERGKNIIRVPTLIIYKEGKEIGRIVEYPKKNLEADLLSILKGEKYIPNYHSGG